MVHVSYPSTVRLQLRSLGILFVLVRTCPSAFSRFRRRAISALTSISKLALRSYHIIDKSELFKTCAFLKGQGD